MLSAELLRTQHWISPQHFFFSALFSFMYVLIVYDVEVKRVTKAHKFLKRHLHWVQNSVFEGEVTDAQLATIKAGLKGFLDSELDSVLIYTARDQRWMSKEILGKERGETGNIL